VKDLIVVRHGKSSWDDPALPDRERPLTKRGRKAVPEMARRLRGRHVRPERIVTSDAVRARDTAMVLAEVLGLDADAVVPEPRLYATDAGDVLEVVRALDDRCAWVAIVGHNPALQDFLALVADLALERFPTAAVAHLRFPVRHWAEVRAGSGEVVDVDHPNSGRD